MLYLCRNVLVPILPAHELFAYEGGISFHDDTEIVRSYYWSAGRLGYFFSALERKEPDTEWKPNEITDVIWKLWEQRCYEGISQMRMALLRPPWAYPKMAPVDKRKNLAFSNSMANFFQHNARIINEVRELKKCFWSQSS